MVLPEIRVSPTPLSEDGDAVYVADPGDASRMSYARPDGGLMRCFGVGSPDELFADLQVRMSRVVGRLEAARRVYIFGAHLNGAKCLTLCRNVGIEVVAFIDNDPGKQGHTWQGAPVLPLSAVSDRSVVVINSSGRHAVAIDNQLSRANFENKLHFTELLFAFNLPFQAEKHFTQFLADVVRNRNRYATLFLALADDKSRSVLDNLLLYRLTLDAHVAKAVSDPVDEEFFCKEIVPSYEAQVFVDGGAYDGDSMARFAALYPSFRFAHLYEPDAEIWYRALRKFASDVRVRVHNAGVFSKSGEAAFSTTGGMDGAIVEGSGARISVVSLDEHVKECITYLKLDVEGSEQEALEGARSHVVRDRPFLALAAYHRSGDLWRIPSLIEAFGARYRFYVRHYSEMLDDSIIYALPA